jgi:hypothetical protein
MLFWPKVWPDAVPYGFAQMLAGDNSGTCIVAPVSLDLRSPQGGLTWYLALPSDGFIQLVEFVESIEFIEAGSPSL